MKRWIAILMVVVTLFVMIPCVSAADAKTEVEKDIASMLFDGKAWDAQAFLEGKDSSDIFVIAVDERGFQYGGGSADYGFYLYIYNPSRRTLIWNSEKNMAQMAVAWEDDRATDFEKFELQLVSKSANNDYLKYKVVDHYSAGDKLTMETRMNLYQQRKSKRLYEISSIELLNKGESNATDYAYGAKVEVTGFEAKRGKSGNNENTKKLTYMASTTLQLDVHQVYWRTQTGKDVGYRNQINGAYFAVPNDVWDNYEKLYSIKCTWEEYRTKPMIVTDDETLYDILLSYVGMRIRPGKMNLDYILTAMSNIVPGVMGSPTVVTYDYVYNKVKTESASLYTIIKNEINPLNWLFLAESEMKLNAEVVSAATVVDYYKRHKDDLSLLTNEVDEGRTAGRNYVVVNLEGTDADGNPMFPLDNYLDHHTKWEAFWAYTWLNGGKSFKSVDLDEDYSDTFEPITVFRKGDSNTVALLSDSLEEIATNHFLQTEDMAKEFRDFVKTAHANDETVVLFRYAETDFYSATLDVYPEIEGHAMVSWQTAFLDFDVIQLGFHDEKRNLIVVPVSNDPEDVLTDPQMPNTSTTDPDLVGTQLKDQAKEILDTLGNGLKQLGYWAGMIGLALLAVVVILLVINVIPMLTRWIERMSTGERRRNGNKRSSKPKGSKPKGSRSKK